ncbi:MAG: subunit of succinyl-CoA:benzylsuccinate CoA-transferase [Caulobacteraceae bacterium]|nr:subunit of succinyl-CoA:benzylsuccinate CoA-transferase [Caulobacteraceae bacterium]
MTGWLSPYRVIDLTDERGLLAGQMLAKLGADVIQVEPPGGSTARRVGPFDAEGRSLYWSAYAAGKRGVTLDVETLEGRARLLDLLAGADILIESAEPGRMAAMGLDFASLARAFPRLICVSVTPFGSDGPKRDWAASELTLWAAGGPLFPHRDVEGPPLRISAPQAWLHGAADAAAGALIALFARHKTGRGQSVDISVQQSVTPATLSFIAAAAVGHDGYTLVPRPVRPPGPPDGEPPLRGPKWRVADGLVELTLGGGPFGARSNVLFAWMKEEEALPGRFESWDWTTIPLRPAAGDPIEAQIAAARDAVAAFLAPRTKAGLEREAVMRGLLLAPVNTMADLLASAHLKARDYFVTIDEGGAARTLPGRFARGPEGMFAEPRPAPLLGEHNDQVFGKLRPPSRPSAALPPRQRGERRISPPPQEGDPEGVEEAAAPCPFQGLKVLDLAWVVAGPALGRALADFGATVVRVESSVRIETARLMGPYAGGQPDPQRCALYDTYNAGKLGMTLDLGHPDARAVVRDLARWADVVVESFVPGQMARWGLSPDSLRQAKPGLIVLSTSLMGQTGPSSALTGYGNIGAAMAGFQSIVGTRGGTPLGPYGPYTDFVGPRFGLVALLTALDRRRATGEGCWLDISQAEAGIQFLAPQVADAAASGRVAAPLGNRDPQFAPHGVFACAGEDRWIALVAHDDAAWARLAGRIGGGALDGAFKTLVGRKAEEDRLEALIEMWTSVREVTELEGDLQSLGIAAHRAADSADMVADPQLAARGHFIHMPHPLGGDCVIEASRFRLSATPARCARPAPHFGRDTQEVLTGILGYGSERVAALDAAGALR